MAIRVVHDPGQQAPMQVSSARMDMAALMSSACPTIPATASVWMGCTAKMSAASSPSACCRSLGASPGLPPASPSLLYWACHVLLSPLSHCCLQLQPVRCLLMSRLLSFLTGCCRGRP